MTISRYPVRVTESLIYFRIYSTTGVLPIVEGEMTSFSFEHCKREGSETPLEVVNFTRQHR